MDTDFIPAAECQERGGHFWNYYDSHGPSDKYGRQDRSFRYALGGTPTYFRKCGLCGITQQKIPERWDDI